MLHCSGPSQYFFPGASFIICIGSLAPEEPHGHTGICGTQASVFVSLSESTYKGLFTNTVLVRRAQFYYVALDAVVRGTLTYVLDQTQLIRTQTNRLQNIQLKTVLKTKTKTRCGNRTHCSTGKHMSETAHHHTRDEGFEANAVPFGGTNGNHNSKIIASMRLATQSRHTI